ncbi:MAG: hypothetical protein A3E87_02925, partial [Gammaproteobacteria bacterium RIFCSPHIGHO2_12_FULL_35_23]
MKRLINILIFLALCPALSALGIQTNADYSSENYNYNPNAPFGYQPPSQESSSLSLDSQLFGMKGPLQIGTEYSQNYGVILKAQYTQQLGQNNAFSLLLNGGAGQRRINATWAHILTTNQRIKLSIDHLSQRMQFNFDSGNVNQWVGQNAYGLTYQYLLNKGWFNDFNLNSFYSQADSKSLSPVYYNQGDDLYENFRHIAGGNEKSLSAGLDLLPTKSTGLGMQLSYDDIHYDMLYPTSNQNQKGLGFTVSLDQLITKKIKLNLVASDREAARQYTAGIDFLIPTAHQSSLEVDLNTERSIGGKGLPDDTTYGMNFDFRWGQGNNNDSFSLSRNTADEDLADWASTPAVDMDQVLAIADQKTVLVSSDETSKAGVSTAAPTNTKTITLYIDPSKPVTINLAQYVPMTALTPSTPTNTNLLLSNNLLAAPLLTASATNDNYKVEDLPNNLAYNPSTKEISGILPKNFTPFTVEVIPETKPTQSIPLTNASGFTALTPNNGLPPNNNSPPTSNVNLIIKNSLLTVSAAPPVPNPLRNQNVAVTWAMTPVSGTSAFTNPSDSGPITYQTPTLTDKNGAATALSALNLTWASNQLYSGARMPASAQANSPYTVIMSASNSIGTSTNNFTLNIVTGAPPTPSPIPNQNVAEGNQITTINATNYFYIIEKTAFGTPTITNASGQSVSLSSLNLQWNNNILSSSGNLPAGSNANEPYTITFSATNPFGSTTNSMTLYVLAKPNALPISNQTVAATQTITPIDATAAFTNPKDSGSITYTIPTITDRNGSAVSLAALNLAWNNNTLSSSTGLPSTMANSSPFILTFAATNNAGTTTNPTTLTITSSMPNFNNLPASLTINEGQNYNPLIDLVPYINAGSDSVLSNVTAELTDGTLADSGLSYQHNSDFSQMAISGQANGAYAGQSKQLHIVVTNSHGNTNDAYITLNFRGLPIRNGTQSITESYEQGQTISSIDFDNFFNNPATSGTLTFNTTDQNSIQVTSPDQSTTTFATSPLAQADTVGNKLTFDNDVLSGPLPNDLASGTYVLTVHAQNDVGFATGAFYITLNINEAGSPSFINLPSTLTADEATSYDAANPLIDLTNLVVPGSGTISSIQAELTDSTLATAGLTYSATSHQITGTVNNAYAGTQKTLHIIATNTINKQSAVDLTITFRGLPLRNNASIGTQNYEGGQTITPIDLTQFFNNPDYSGTLTFNDNDINSIQVNGPNGSSTLSQSALGGPNGLVLNGTELTGQIPASVTTGTYILDVIGKNDLGYATQRATITFNLNEANAPQFDLPASALVVYNQSYTSTNPLSDIADHTFAGSGTIQT